MYSEEFENLLKEYLTDGIITTKERQVLLKKAQQLGYDIDEVDLYIDAQQQKCDQAVEAAAAKKRGKVCPRCGASVQSMQLTCPECGFEFNNEDANANAKELMKLIEEANNTDKKIEIIRNYPIPNTKENLTEFLALCTSNSTLTWHMRFGDNSNDEYKICCAWRDKSKQVIVKSRLMLKEEPSIMSLVDKLEKEISKKSYRLNLTFLGTFFCALIPIVLLFGVYIYDKESDKTTKTENVNNIANETSQSNYINDCIKSGDINNARDYLIPLLQNVEDVDKYEPLFLNVLNAYMNEDDYDSAESFAILLRAKYNNDYKWEHSSVYKTLKAKFKAKGRDFSTLKSESDYDEE